MSQKVETKIEIGKIRRVKKENTIRTNGKC